MAVVCDSLESRVLFSVIEVTQTTVVTPPGRITGTLYHDRNFNYTFDTGDVGRGGRLVYLDHNGNNAFDVGETWTMTDARGRYAFEGLQPGRYRLRGFQGTWAGVEGRDVNVRAGTETRTLMSISNRAPLFFSGISGQVWGDTDGNGKHLAGEIGQGNRRVYLDLDGDRARDDSEPSTVTDERGQFRFQYLKAGRYFVQVEETPDGHVAASPNGGRSSVETRLGTFSHTRIGLRLPVLLP